MPLIIWSQTSDSSFQVHFAALVQALEDRNLTQADSIVKTLASKGPWISSQTAADLALRYAASKEASLSLDRLLSNTRSLLQQFAPFPSLEEHRIRLLLRTVQGCRRHSQVDSMQQYLLRTQRAIAQLQAHSFFESTYYYEWGRYAYLRHDFEGSLLHLRRGLDYVIAHFPDRIQTRLNFMNGIGIALRRLNQVSEALQHHLGTLAYIREADADSPWVGNVLNNIGLCYSNLKQYDRAVDYQKEAVEAYRKLDERYRDQIATGYDNIGISYLFQGQYDSAAQYSRLSLAYMKNQFGVDHADLLLPITSLGRIYLAANELTRADSFIQYGCKKLQEFGWSVEHPTGQFFLEDALTLFDVGMQVRQGMAKQDHMSMDQIFDLRFARGFMATADHAFYDVQNERSRTAFLSNQRRRFSNVIRQYHAAYEHSNSSTLFMEALNTIEKYKSYHLSALAYRDRVADSDDFKKLNATHRELLRKVRLAEQKAKSFEGESLPDSIALTVQETNSDFQLWQSEVKAAHPNYVGLVRSQEDIPIDYIRRQLLGQDQALASYYLDSNRVYILSMDQRKESFVCSETSHEISNRIQLLSSAVTALGQIGLGDETLYFQNLTSYSSLAQELYQTLLAPIEILSARRLMIIPDGHLWYLPYEVLLEEQPEDAIQIARYPYALHRYSMGYAYSLHLWRELEDGTQDHGGLAKIMAPTFGTAENSNAIRNDDLGNLAYSSWEASQLAALLNTEPIMGGDATIEAFKRDLDQQKIIHLSTHAISNLENNRGYLMFAPDGQGRARLMTEEIYDLQLNADLVALSACESGLGRFELGGGLISLSRAFSYAGARSLLSSLWPVSDFSTAKITQDIYRNLRKGQPKDIALKNAKQRYLEESDHLAAHPFFWAGMIVTGDPKAIYPRGLPSPIKKALLTALLTILALLVYRHLSQRLELK